MCFTLAQAVEWMWVQARRETSLPCHVRGDKLIPKYNKPSFISRALAGGVYKFHDYKLVKTTKNKHEKSEGVFGSEKVK